MLISSLKINDKLLSCSTGTEANPAPPEIKLSILNVKHTEQTASDHPTHTPPEELLHLGVDCCTFSPG